MEQCKKCGWCLPTGEKYMCLNPKNRQGDFVMFINKNDNNEILRKRLNCFQANKGAE